MDYQQIITLINTVGFPIFVCCALGWYIYKTEDKQTEALTALTNAVNKLLEKLKGIKED